MTGGELAAQAMIDATVRLLPDVLGNAESTVDESHSNGLLEHPQYTRPANWMGREIPEVLTSGNHAKVAEWRKEQSGNPNPTPPSRFVGKENAKRRIKNSGMLMP